MTTAGLGLATKSAATLSISNSIKALVYRGSGRRAWEGEPRPAIQDPGDAIVWITNARRGSKASGGRSSAFPLPGILPFKDKPVMSVTSFGDACHILMLSQ